MEGPLLFNMCALCAITVGFPATLVLLTTLAPGYIKRARAVVRQRPGQSFLLGLGNFVFFFSFLLLVWVAGRLQDRVRDPLIVLSTIPTTFLLPPFMLVGFTIVAGIVGEQFLLQTIARPGSLMGSLAVGALLCGLVALVPIVGWTFLLILILVGMGAAVIAFVQQTRKPSLVVDEALE
jgi:MFS family permease